MSVSKSIATMALSGADAHLSDDSAGALSDTLDLRRRAVGIKIHAAGTVRYTTPDQTDGTYTEEPAMAVGVIHPVAIKRLWATGTTVAEADITLYYANS